VRDVRFDSCLPHALSVVGYGKFLDCICNMSCSVEMRGCRTMFVLGMSGFVLPVLAEVVLSEVSLWV
jgi:hypothetical protein